MDSSDFIGCYLSNCGIEQSDLNVEEEEEQTMVGYSLLPSFSSIFSSNLDSVLSDHLSDADGPMIGSDYPTANPPNSHSTNADSLINTSLSRLKENLEEVELASCSPRYYYSQGYEAFPSNSMVETPNGLTFEDGSDPWSSQFSSPTISPPEKPSYLPQSSQPTRPSLPISPQPDEYSSTRSRHRVSTYYPPPYTDSQSNSVSPLNPGFKPSIRLNTSGAGRKDYWNPNAAKKIMETYYSPLNLKSEFLSTQSALDEFQSLTLKEAIAAFHDVAFSNMFKMSFDYEPDACPNKTVETCSKLRAYRRLHIEDKITLLSNVFFDLIALKSILTYDQLTDGWKFADKRIDRRDLYLMSPDLHNDITRIIETFPDRWRKDLTVASLVYLITIFNPDLPGLRYAGSIRSEQYGYIYLLKRYLEVVCDTPCDASDYHYQLMVKLDEIQSLRHKMVSVFEITQTGSLDKLASSIGTLQEIQCRS